MNNYINDKNKNCHCTCDCENFARQINNEYYDCSSPFPFQDSDVIDANEEVDEMHDMERIANSLENLQITDNVAPLRR